MSGGEYRQTYDRSMTDPDGFWREAASLIDWYTEPETIMDASALPFSRWFGGGELNTCHNCLVAAHPGLTSSELLNNALARGGTWRSRLLTIPDRLLSQPVDVGIGPQLLAATGAGSSGDHLGPMRSFETRGPAGPARRSRTAQDPGLARELWDITAAATATAPDPAPAARP